MSPPLLFAAATLLSLPGCDASATKPAKAPVAADLPALTGRVVDEADLLSPVREAELAAKLAQLEARRTDQFVVVTVPSLAARSIEQFGLQLGRSWGVGQRGKNNGLLLIVAPTERQVRIEVGYGLEAHLTDEEAAKIISDQLLPAFRAGAMEAGIVSGAEAVIAELDRSPLVKARP